MTSARFMHILCTRGDFNYDDNSLLFLTRIERKIATISLESRDGPSRLGDNERGKKKGNSLV